MDIPDLPQGAFEHIGDKKIKPQGGGGGIVSAITDPISDVLGTSGGGGGILGAVEDVGEFVDKNVTQPIGQGLSEVDKFVGREIPGGWTTVGLTGAALAAPYAAPYLAGEGAAFTGATETGLATLAGEGAAADTVGTTLLAGLAESSPAAVTAATEAATAAALEATTALPYTEAFDAYNLAQQGLGAEQIAQNLTITANVDPFIAQDIGQMAARGLSPEAIVQNLQYSYNAAELAPLNLESKAAVLPRKGLTAAQALQGARMASGLLGGQQRPQQQMPMYQMSGGGQVRPAGAVDYSGLLALLTPRQTSRMNPNSLLG
jgi:hypothetical protein